VYAPRLDKAVPRSFVSAMCMRSIDTKSTDFRDDVNRIIGISAAELELP
jgi:hypothetical protein